MQLFKCEQSVKYEGVAFLHQTRGEQQEGVESSLSISSKSNFHGYYQHSKLIVNTYQGDIDFGKGIEGQTWIVAWSDSLTKKDGIFGARIETHWHDKGKGS